MCLHTKSVLFSTKLASGGFLNPDKTLTKHETLKMKPETHSSIQDITMVVQEDPDVMQTTALLECDKFEESEKHAVLVGLVHLKADTIIAATTENHKRQLKITIQVIDKLIAATRDDAWDVVVEDHEHSIFQVVLIMIHDWARAARRHYPGDDSSQDEHT